MLSVPIALAVGLGVSIVATSFLSGLFGMAGGMVLMGLLLLFLPVPAAMILHGVTQVASNGWRAWLWRAHVAWPLFFAYVVDDLAAGRLVAPFDLTVPKGRAWYLVYRPRRADEPAMAAFRAWLIAAARGE